MNRKAVAKLLWMPALLVLVGLACNIRSDAPTAVPAACPIGAQAVPIPARPTDAVGYPAAITRYLADGASPQDLERLLRNEWGVINERWGTVNADYDLNHDGLKDVVVTFFFANPSVPQPPGMMLIFGCVQDGGSAHYEAFFAPATDPRDVTSLPQLINNQLRDLTGDGWAEVAYFTVQCSSNICYSQPYIRSWRSSSGGGGELVSLLPPDLSTFFIRENRQAGVQQDALAGFVSASFDFVGASADVPDTPPLNLVIQEGMPGREAGLWRPRTLTLHWNSSTNLYDTPEVEVSVPLYYIQALLDADRMLTTGDPESAIAAYQTLLDDHTLAFWGGISWSQDNLFYEERMLRAYTHYRLILAHAAAHTGNAQRELDAMQKDRAFAQGDIPTYFTLLAEDFVTAFLQSENSATALSNACSVVDARFSAANWQAVWQNMQPYLGTAAYYGPNIPEYNLSALCPFNGN